MCIRIITVFILSLPIFTFAQSKQTVQWQISIEAPITYLDGGEFSGYGVEYINLIQEKMGEYTHEFSVAGNYKRLALEVQTGPLSCAVGLFKTEERLKNMYFSTVPIFYFFNIQIVLRKSTFDELNQPKTLSLRSLLEQKGYNLGISFGRTYSDTVREILDEFEGASNIFVGAQGNVADNLFQMLMKGRIDYMFLYPEEAVYLSGKLGFEGQIVTVPIEEAADLSVSWVVCTKNDEGKKAISRISEVLSEARKTEEYRSLYEKWISENLLEIYRSRYKTDFLAR